MSDQTPTAIRVWVCSQCGYWRQERSTGLHASYPTRVSEGETHELEEAQYIFEGTTGKRGLSERVSTWNSTTTPDAGRSNERS